MNLSGLRRYNIYCDLDGVLADFMGRFTELSGGVKFDDMSQDEAWGIVKSAPRFWEDLQPTAHAHAIWDMIHPFAPMILTAPSTTDTARAMAGKKDWVARAFGSHVPVIFRQSKHKYQLAAPDAILIDDWGRNIRQWREAGGIGIQYKGSMEDVIGALALLADIPITDRKDQGGLYARV